MFGCTYCYCPPEILHKDILNGDMNFVLEKIDVYCWGMTMYCLITGKNDEELANEVDLYKEMGKDYNKFMQILDGIVIKDDPDQSLTKFFIPILKKSLEKNPTDRPSFAEIKKKLDEFIQFYRINEKVLLSKQLADKDQEIKSLKDKLALQHDDNDKKVHILENQLEQLKKGNKNFK